MTLTDAGLPGEELPAEEPRRRRLRDRRVLMVTLTALATVLVVVVGGLTVVVARLDGNIERLDDPFAALPTRPEQEPADDGAVAADPPAAAPAAAGEAVNILVLGSDSRVSAGDPSQWAEGAQRTDVMMLVHLPADGQTGYVMSIPRDAWVPIPGHGEAKLNAAFSFGGPTLLIQTVEQLTGVTVDHFAMTDFESFKHITDALGGVTITLREDLVERGELILPAGTHTMTGDQALTYVRQRKNLARGDFDRVQRQQAWIRAMVRQARDAETLQDPAKWYPVLDAVTLSVAVDEGLTRTRMVDLLMQVKDLGAGDIFFFTVPVDGIGTSDDGQSIVLLDRPQLDELMASVRADDVDQYLIDNPSAVDRLPLRDP